jgi:hypothetical protein
MIKSLILCIDKLQNFIEVIANFFDNYFVFLSLNIKKRKIDSNHLNAYLQNRIQKLWS